MPMFKLVNEDGVWLEDARLGVADWKPGDRIAQGRESLEVVEVRADAETPVLVVRSGRGSKSD
jgi:hypothetical protein